MKTQKTSHIIRAQEAIDTLFTLIARIEELFYPGTTLLPSFPRSLQSDAYSCGAKAVYMILKYFGTKCTPHSVEHELHTDQAGTRKSDIKRVLEKHGLKFHSKPRMHLKDLTRAVKNGLPVLVSLYDGWHYGVVYGYAPKHLFVMNPSLGEMGSFKCALGLDEWRLIFDGWGIVIRKPQKSRSSV